MKFIEIVNFAFELKINFLCYTYPIYKIMEIIKLNYRLLYKNSTRF